MECHNENSSFFLSSLPQIRFQSWPSNGASYGRWTRVSDRINYLLTNSLLMVMLSLAWNPQSNVLNRFQTLCDRNEASEENLNELNKIKNNNNNHPCQSLCVCVFPNRVEVKQFLWWVKLSCSLHLWMPEQLLKINYSPNICSYFRKLCSYTDVLDCIDRINKWIVNPLRCTWQSTPKREGEMLGCCMFPLSIRLLSLQKCKLKILHARKNIIRMWTRTRLNR